MLELRAHENAIDIFPDIIGRVSLSIRIAYFTYFYLKEQSIG
jgi:hypothetical protein